MKHLTILAALCLALMGCSNNDLLGDTWKDTKIAASSTASEAAKAALPQLRKGLTVLGQMWIDSLLPDLDEVE